MQYLLKSNQLILSGTKEMIMQYISTSHRSSLNDVANLDNWSNNYASFEKFIESLGYSIENKIPSNCKIDGTKITSAQFLKAWKECNYNITETGLKLKIAERNVANIIKKMNLRRK